MIEALRDIGMYSLKQKGINTNNLIDILLDEVNKGGNYQKVYAINFEENEKGLRYKDVSVEDWDKRKKLKYLYREKTTRGAHYTPTARITGYEEADVSKTFENRIKNWFDRLKKEHPYWLDDSTFLENLHEAFTRNKDQIKADLVKMRMQYDDGGFITLVFYQGGEKKYLGDIEVFVEYLLEFSKEKYNEVSNNGVCCLCNNMTRVFGDASPITFYTLDKQCYIAGGMWKENGYKNFPVCFECLLQLTEGAAYMQELLEFKFAGIKYYLIPQVTCNKNEILDEIMNVYQFFWQESKGKVSLLQADRIAADEDDILSMLKNVDDKVLLKFLFFQKRSNEFTILMLMEDILPSRIRSLFNAKRMAEDHLIFKDHKFSAKLIQDIKFNYGVLRKFFPTTKGFLEIVNKSFKDQKIDKQYILQLVMDRIRELFNDSSYIKIEVLQAFICLLFLNELGVLKNMGGDLDLVGYCNKVIVKSELGAQINEFFEEFKSTFNNSAKKAIFLTGVLAQHLLSIQKTERGSTPFRNHFKGLKLKEADVKALLPKIQQKLEEYKKNYYVQLEQIASLYYLQAGENWGMSVDEINFYFVLGMNLNGATNKDGIPYFKVKGDE